MTRRTEAEPSIRLCRAVWLLSGTLSADLITAEPTPLAAITLVQSVQALTEQAKHRTVHSSAEQFVERDTEKTQRERKIETEERLFDPAGDTTLLISLNAKKNREDQRDSETQRQDIQQEASQSATVQQIQVSPVLLFNVGGATQVSVVKK